MTLTVPPVWIFALLVAVAAGGAALEPPELDEHAARPPAAMAAAASAATRAVLDIGMWHVPLGVQSSCRAGCQRRPCPTSISAYREILRYWRSYPYQIARCGSIVM